MHAPEATNDSGCYDIDSSTQRPMRPTCLVSSRRFLAQNFYDRRILAFSSTSFVRKQSKHLPEHEYQVRLGAAIQVLRETLPTFMEQGLVDRMPSENSSSLLRVLKMGVPCELMPRKSMHVAYAEAHSPQESMHYVHERRNTETMLYLPLACQETAVKPRRTSYQMGSWHEQAGRQSGCCDDTNGQEVAKTV